MIGPTVDSQARLGITTHVERVVNVYQISSRSNTSSSSSCPCEAWPWSSHSSQCTEETQSLRKHSLLSAYHAHHIQALLCHLPSPLTPSSSPEKLMKFSRSFSMASRMAASFWACSRASSSLLSVAPLSPAFVCHNIHTMGRDQGNQG